MHENENFMQEDEHSAQAFSWMKIQFTKDCTAQYPS